MTCTNLLVRPISLCKAKDAFIAPPHERVAVSAHDESLYSVKRKLANTGLLLK